MSARDILVGVVGRPHGVRGRVHVTSYTADPANLTSYGPLHDGRGRRFRLRWEGEGIARIGEVVEGRTVWVSERESAAKLTNLRLHVARDRLPAPAAEEFYHADLVGLAAETPDGAPLGRIDAVHDYGAGASLEIGALLVPFTRAAVPLVDIAGGRVVVIPPETVDVRPEGADVGEAGAAAEVAS